jgi:CubicO group peptidase (beta-lactamase class C family)
MSFEPPIAGFGAERLPRTIDVIQRGRERGLHHGVQVCVRQNGETIADLAVGESSDGRPLTPETLLPWLSAGKPITALAFLTWLFDSEYAGEDSQGLDTPVTAVVPEFGANGKEPITFRHILTHMAGVAPVPTGWPQASWDQIVSRVCEAGVLAAFRVGVDAAYDPNRSWFILGEILQRQTGVPIAEHLKQSIGEPAGMTDSWLAMPADVHHAYGDRIGAVAVRDPDGQLKTTHGHSPEMCAASSPGSSWRGPIHDLAKFYEFLRSSAPPVMKQRHRTGLYDRTFQHKIDFGLGIIIDSNRYGKETVPYGFGRHCSENTYGHGGAQSSIGFCDDDNALIVAAVANGLPGEAQHNRRFRDLNSAIYEDLGLAGDV